MVLKSSALEPGLAASTKHASGLAQAPHLVPKNVSVVTCASSSVQRASTVSFACSATTSSSSSNSRRSCVTLARPTSAVSAARTHNTHRCTPMQTSTDIASTERVKHS
eukprot:16608-Heterococcus_DN1.PRE.4